MIEAGSSFWDTDVHKKLLLASNVMKTVQLSSIINSEDNFSYSIYKNEGVVYDFSRQHITSETFGYLIELAKVLKVEEKIQAMFQGSKLNVTEQRSVFHVGLRMPVEDTKSSNSMVSASVTNVHKTLDHIKQFAEKFRSGHIKGHTGKMLKDVICIGIGGSYLGTDFVYTALATEPKCAEAAKGRQLRFLANVDPIDFVEATKNLNPETTFVIVISKTFTTKETMTNAQIIRDWLLATLKDPSAIAKHVCGVTTNVQEAVKFGISESSIFPFWDWVGGRFSVCSAVGCLPLALHYGMEVVLKFLQGCRAMDNHFMTAKLDQNLPVLQGLVSFWNTVYMGLSTIAILPYCQALLKFPNHIQQLAMESNGKGVTSQGKKIPSPYNYCGQFYFGETGTNGQHSFYQSLHQGRPAQCEFIGFCQTQNSKEEKTAKQHDQLMANFFAQPDALALGKSEEQCKSAGIPNNLIPHKQFEGNRPSTLLLLPKCEPYAVGKLLALYEHRVAVEGFLWGINSFDQWGVELGKELAKQMQVAIEQARKNPAEASKLDYIPKSTAKVLECYVSMSKPGCYT